MGTSITYYEDQLRVLEAWFKQEGNETVLIARNRELEGEYNATMREMHTLGAENVALQGAFDHALIEELAERREYEVLLHDQYVWALAHAKAQKISTTTISSGSSSTTSGTTTSTTTTHSSSSSSSSSTATATVSGGGSTTVQALEVDAQPETTEQHLLRRSCWYRRRRTRPWSFRLRPLQEEAERPQGGTRLLLDASMSQTSGML